MWQETASINFEEFDKLRKKSGWRFCEDLNPGTLVLSRLDYCNSILANLPDVTLAPLVRVQHSAARLIRNLKRQDPVLPLMMELHWLPLRFRITFKLCVLMHGVHYGTGPKYMKELVTPTSSLPGRERLRSATTMNYDIEPIWAHQAQIRWKVICRLWSNSLEHSSC